MKANKIHTLEYVDYKLPVETADIVLETIYDPRILAPYTTLKEQGQQYLVYRPTTYGQTLRSYIVEINKLRRLTSLRSTFSKQATITPIKLLLRLVDVYEYLMSRNRLLSPSHINPDLIWIDFDAEGTIQIQLLDIANANPICEHNEKLYWSPEMLSKYSAVAYYNIDKQLTLKRCDTRPSAMSTVYSLGLVLYFIVSGKDPFEGSRVNVYERPPSLLSFNPIYGKLIWIATNSDPKQRPTLAEWRTTIERMDDNRISSGCCGG